MREAPRLGVIVGGVQKAGTTSLFNYLDQHPTLVSGGRKELHYFDDERRDWSRPDYAALDALFGSPGRMGFEVTPIYLFWPRALERISRYNPRAKLIFIFRDPIERAFSHWRMEVGRGAETLSFADAIRGGRDRMGGPSTDERTLRSLSYVERGFYGRQLRRALEVFPRESMLLLRSGDLAADHGAVLDRVAAFVGIAPFGALAARFDHSVGGQAKVPPADVAYLRELFAADAEEFAALGGPAVHEWLGADAFA